MIGTRAQGVSPVNSGSAAGYEIIGFHPVKIR